MISVIIPVYNEEKNVGVLHARIHDVLRRMNEPFEIIFIDDGSRDLTYENLKKLHPVMIVCFRRNFIEYRPIDLIVCNQGWRLAE